MVGLAARADWSYIDHADPMNSGKIKHAMLVSENQFTLDFPYQGLNFATLHIQQQGKSRHEVAVSIEKGQILCRHGNCDIKVRFDDAKPVTFEGAPQADHDPKFAYLKSTDSARFVASSLKAKRILVQVTLYRQGSPLLEFVSAIPFAWPTKK